MSLQPHSETTNRSVTSDEALGQKVLISMAAGRGTTEQCRDLFVPG